MENTNKANIRVFTIFSMLLTASIICLWFTFPDAYSCYQYFVIQDEIDFANETADKVGWTDNNYQEVKALEQKRAEMAKEDAIFGLCDATRVNPTNCLKRNLMFIKLIFQVVGFSIIALGSIIILLSRPLFYARRTIGKIRKAVHNKYSIQKENG